VDKNLLPGSWGKTISGEPAERPVVRMPTAVPAEIASRRAAAANFPSGTAVRARVALAHPKPGEVAIVIEATSDGDLRLEVKSRIEGFTALVRPDQIEPISPTETLPDEFDNEPF